MQFGEYSFYNIIKDIYMLQVKWVMYNKTTLNMSDLSRTSRVW